MDYKEYKKLNKYEEYDKEAAEELAAAMNEKVELERRVEQLDDIISDNDHLHPLIWRTADGNHLAIHAIEDSHLKNILLHLSRQGRPVSAALKAEARKRGIAVPSSSSIALLPYPFGDYDWEERGDED